METISTDSPVPRELFFDLCRAISSAQEARAVVGDNDHRLEYKDGCFNFMNTETCEYLLFGLNDLTEMNQKHMRYALLLNVANTDGIYPCFAGKSPTMGEA
jgi:hypothetical protein